MTAIEQRCCWVGISSGISGLTIVYLRRVKLKSDNMQNFPFILFMRLCV